MAARRTPVDQSGRGPRPRYDADGALIVDEDIDDDNPPAEPVPLLQVAPERQINHAGRLYTAGEILPADLAGEDARRYLAHGWAVLAESNTPRRRRG